MVVLLGACVTHGAPISGTQSLKIELVAPTDPGSISTRLPDPMPGTASVVTVNVTALDADGNLDTTYDRTVDVYVHYLGTLTPYLGGTPLLQIQMVAGVATNQMVTLPPVFGPTTLWFDDGIDSSSTYATGVSPTLWFRDPLVHDIEAPADESAPTALYIKPLDSKNVSVRASRYGDRGMLVVSSVYSQGYTIADVQCADTNGTPPCTAADYDHLDVFSYSAPRDQDMRFLVEGERITGFAGGVTEFDGLTELGFPQTFVANVPDVNKAREPAAVVVPRTCSNNQMPCLVQSDCSGGVCDAAWFTTPIDFERNEGGPIEIDNAKVCNIDADYTTYKQWKLDLSGAGGNCARYINVISSSIPIDPTKLENMIVPRVVGILRPINLGPPAAGVFNVFIIYPRSIDDLTLP